MSISFSGLASGLDTSSWITSLTALKNAKVTELQEERENVLLSKETLNSIKSFFSSFRATIEKITDTKFNIATMDVFAQNLALSSNVSILTATATTEAEEGVYEVVVDKLATNTSAVSNYTYTTTIIETTIADLNSKLTDLGVNIKSTGSSIGVKVNGVERGLLLEQDDTIGTFIDKLKNIGVDANYNLKTGVFSMNINADDINDVDNTDIVNAMHLQGVNEGYTSNNLQIEKTDTIYSAATTDTLMSELGVNTGIITVSSNDSNYNVTITDSTTLGDFISDLNNLGIDAELDATGIFTITGAEITNEGTTDILNALGMDIDVYSKTQKTNDLRVETVLVESTTATTSTLLKDIGDGLEINADDTVIVKNSSNELTTITIDDTTTIGDLLNGINSAGLSATIDSNGNISISGGTITGGTFDAVSAFGLTETPNSSMVTGNPISVNVANTNVATLSTKLVEDLGISKGYLEVVDTSGDAHYEKIHSGQTISQFISDLSSYGISASLDSNGILSIVGGSFNTLSDDDVQNLVDNGTITETDSSYIKGSDILTKMFGSETIDSNHTSTGTASFKTPALSYAVASTVGATGTTTLSNFGISNSMAVDDRVVTVYDSSGNSLKSFTVTESTTLNSLISDIDNNDGGVNAQLSDGRLYIDGGYIENTALEAAMGLSTSRSSSFVLGSIVETTTTATATGSAKLSDIIAHLGTESAVSSEYTLTFNGQYNGGTTTLNGDTTLNDIVSWINGLAGTAYIQDGALHIDNGTISGTVATALGFTSVTVGATEIGSTPLTTIQQVFADTDTKLSDVGVTTKTFDVYNRYGASLGSYSLDDDATIGDFFSKLSEAGIDATMSNGRISLSSIDGKYISGEIPTALGIGTSSSTQVVNSTSASTLRVCYTDEVTAVVSTTLGELGFLSSGETLQAVINDETGSQVTTQDFDSDSSINDIFTFLGENGIQASITNGMISLYSPDGYTLGGTLASAFGITTTNSSSQTTTIGKTLTSTAKVTYTVSSAVSGSTKISDVVTIDSNAVIDVHSVDGTDQSYITITQDTTFDEFFAALESHNINAEIHSNKITFGIAAEAESGYVIQDSSGTVLSQLGITINYTNSEASTLGQVTTSTEALTFTATITHLADETTTLADLGLTNASDRVLNIYDENGTATDTVTFSQTATVEGMSNYLNSAGLSLSISNGIITITQNEGSNSTIGGTLAENLGITRIDNSSTNTIAKTTTSTTPITYTVLSGASEDTTMAELGFDTFGVIRAYSDANAGSDDYECLLTINPDTSIAEFCAIINSNTSVVASFTDGRIVLDNSNGWYLIDGDSTQILTNLGITTTTTTATTTRGTGVTSTAGITFTTVTTVATTLTQITSEHSLGSPHTIVAGHTIDGTMTSTGITGSVIAISTAQDLMNMQTLSASGQNFSGKTFVMTQDITLGTTFTGIESFSGNFDGNGHTITLDIDVENSDNAGLFQDLVNAVVQNLYLAGTISGDGYDVGALAAVANNSTITAVCSEVNIQITASVSPTVGGLIGAADDSTIIGCTVDPALIQVSNTVSGSQTIIGGIIGFGADINMSHSMFCGNLQGDNSTTYIGGFAGQVSYTTITECYTDVSLLGSYSDYVNKGSFFGGVGEETLLNACVDKSTATTTLTNLIGTNVDGNAYLDHCIIFDSSLNTSYCNMDGGLVAPTDSQIQSYIGTYLTTGSWTYEPGVTNSLSLTENGAVTEVIVTENGTLTEVLVTGYATRETTLAELGMSDYQVGNYNPGGIDFYSTWITLSISCTSAMTLGDLMDEIESQSAAVDRSITCTLTEDGKLQLTASNTNGMSIHINSTNETLATAIFTSSGSDIYSTFNPQTTVSTILRLATTATKMSQLGLDDTYTMTLNVDGTQEIVTVNSTDTIGTIRSKLITYGITLSCSDQKVTISNTDTKYVSGMSSELASALKIDSNALKTVITSTTIANTNSNDFSTITTQTVGMTTTLGNLGITGNQTIVIKGTTIPPASITPESYTLVVDSSYSIEGIMNEVNALLDASFMDMVDGNKVRFKNDTGYYIESMSPDLASALNLNIGENHTYQTSVNTSYTNISGVQGLSVVTTNTVTATETTKLENLGVTSDQTISVMSNGVLCTITVSATDTIESLITKLDDRGINASLSSLGTLTVGTTASDNYIISMSDGLKNALKITGNTYSTQSGNTEASISDSNSLPTFTTVQELTTDTTFKQLNPSLSGTATVTLVSNGERHTLTFSVDQTIGETLAVYNAYGISGSIEDGILTLTPNNGCYMESIEPSNVTSILKLGTSVGYTTTVSSSYTNSRSNMLTFMSSDLTINGETPLCDIVGNTTPLGNLRVHLENGSYATISVTPAQTLDDFFGQISAYGLTGSISSDGKVTITGSGNVYLEEVEGGTTLLSALNISGVSQNTQTIFANRTSAILKETNTLKATGTTTLENLVKDGSSPTFDASGNIQLVLTTEQDSNSGSVTTTLTFAKTQTLQDVIDTLAGYGVTAQVNSLDGSFSVSSSMLDLDLEGDLGVFLFGENPVKSQPVGMPTNTSSALVQTVTNIMDSNTKLSDLGITNGNILIMNSGNATTITIDTTDTQTVGDFKGLLTRYGFTTSIDSRGRLSVTNSSGKYLSDTVSGSSNILEKFGITENDFDFVDFEQVSNVLTQSTTSTKLVDLLNSSGTNLGITEGTYLVDKNGVTYTETITATTTVGDFITSLEGYGFDVDLSSNGAITLSLSGDLPLSDGTGNIVEKLFGDQRFVSNTYTSDQLGVSNADTQAINRNTNLGDIDGFTEGYITVQKDGVFYYVSLSASDTVGTLVDQLALYGFDTVISGSGALTIRANGNNALYTYTGAQTASNILDLLGIESANWAVTNTYSGKVNDVVTRTTTIVDATRDTLLSDLGVTTGEYYIYNNGVKCTALISSDETLGSFMDTLNSFGIQTSITSGANGSNLSLLGNGNSYIVKSNSVTNASNIVEQLFDASAAGTNYQYSSDKETSETVTSLVYATKDTLLSEFDTPWGDTTLKAEGDLSVTVDGGTRILKISADETIGSLMDKFEAMGIETSLSSDGKLTLQSGLKSFTINSEGTTSSLINPNLRMGLTYNADLGGYVASSDTVMATTTTVEKRTVSVANFANNDTKLGMMNISDGTFSVYKNGQKATIQIKADETFGQLRTRLAAAFSDLELEFDENGIMKIYSKDGERVEAGSTTDTSNISAVCGFQNNSSGVVTSSRQLYCVDGSSKLTASGIFRRGDVTEGTFIIGDTVFNITNETTLDGIISQINSSQSANANAYWDTVDGKLVITSRTSGSALINIEAGTSNFTDIMGFTTTERNADGSVNVTRLDVNSQSVGGNASFTINGTRFTSTSNTVGSDVTRLNGVTLNLKGISQEGNVTTLTIEKDTDTIANAVEDVVDAYNELIENVDKQIAAGATLNDQSTLKLIRNQIRNLMTSSISSSNVYKNLDAIGISHDAASAGNINTDTINVLSFDKDKFIEAFEADRDSLKMLLIGTDTSKGVFQQIESVLESALASSYGYFSSAEKSYNTKISNLDNKIKKTQSSVERYKERLESKFSSMDMLIANLQNQYSSFLG